MAAACDRAPRLLAPNRKEMSDRRVGSGRPGKCTVCAQEAETAMRRIDLEASNRDRSGSRAFFRAR
jgi:hypothetical protein